MLLNRVVVSLLLALSPMAMADSLDVHMNNTSAQFKLGMSASGIGDGDAELQSRLFFNDASDMLLDAGVFARGASGGGEEGAAGPIAGGGLRVVYSKLDNLGTTYTLACIALGGEFGFALPSSIPISIIGKYLLSPKILSFADAERYNEYGVRLELAASQQAKIYLGFRQIGFGAKNAGSLVLDTGTHIGLVVSW